MAGGGIANHLCNLSHRKICVDEQVLRLTHETVIGEAGGFLSGGEWQRLSIARAMMKDAPIIILEHLGMTFIAMPMALLGIACKRVKRALSNIELD